MQITLSYKTARELGIEQWEHDGLVALIMPLSQGKLRFHIVPTVNSCGTAACIGGWVALRSGKTISEVTPYVMTAHDRLIYDLYYPEQLGNSNFRPTAPQAARAVINFLTLGDPRWDDVMRGA